ncbi:DUF2812 domain-containing protein [Radiobacillus deserti]|uniref:DUF2812 domain-containing protein n=1 Tax=Radiobacillus deserti TaxID=2594883 RepID=A0A516KET2_9BACI|nr:DUF2812 domain-containing protein [Radiobacillus deserti]QDP39922.1 DUF2812 domain-containing protein [Radiobacillus deserti]
MNKKIFKIFWVWQNDAEENWLRNMANNGWDFIRYNWFFYTFKRTEPKDYVYKLDYKGNRKNDVAEYINLFEDAGWEHVGRFQDWYYFRTNASLHKETPDIYSHLESKVKKYKDLSNFILNVLIAVLTIFFTIVLPAKYAYVSILQILYVILILLNGFSYVRLLRKIRRMERTHI